MKIYFEKLAKGIDEKKSYLEVTEDGTVTWHQVDRPVRRSPRTDEEGEEEVFDLMSKGIVVI